MSKAFIFATHLMHMEPPVLLLDAKGVSLFFLDQFLAMGVRVHPSFSRPGGAAPCFTSMQKGSGTGRESVETLVVYLSPAGGRGACLLFNQGFFLIAEAGSIDGFLGFLPSFSETGVNEFPSTPEGTSR